ncbi:MAG: dienelactone hydrolase family protein [Betaproteobacteria bacterium]|nr:dienelactone hydrolase family protein [Betaproteobacteria bacterium]
MSDWRMAMLAAATILGALPVAAAPAGERVSFESSAPDPATGKPVTVQGLLFRPAAAAAPDPRRRPAIVALHGCGGMYSAVKSRRDALSARHQAMAELLVAEGYVVLFPDSFRSRGVEEICTIEAPARTINGAHRRQDAQAALAWLQRRDDVLADRIAVLGWSHGGSAVLAALDGRAPSVAAWRDRSPQPAYFRAGVAFYPGCGALAKARRGYTLAAPLTLFVAGSDDWTAPEPCIDIAARLAAAGEPAAITVYPGAHHGFDGPSSQPRLRLDVPNGVNPGRGVTVATDPAARDDAYEKLKTFLRTRLAPAITPTDEASPGRAAELKSPQEGPP